MRREVPLPLATIAGSAEDVAPSSQIAPPTPAAGTECNERRATGAVIVATQGGEEFAYAIWPPNWGFLRHLLPPTVWEAQTFARWCAVYRISQPLMARRVNKRSRVPRHTSNIALEQHQRTGLLVFVDQTSCHPRWQVLVEK